MLPQLRRQASATGQVAAGAARRRCVQLQLQLALLVGLGRRIICLALRQRRVTGSSWRMCSICVVAVKVDRRHDARLAILHGGQLQQQASQAALTGASSSSQQCAGERHEGRCRVSSAGGVEMMGIRKGGAMGLGVLSDASVCRGRVEVKGSG